VTVRQRLQLARSAAARDANHAYGHTPRRRLIGSLPARFFLEKPEAGSGKPEAGSGKPEAASGKREAGSWKLEAGSW